VGSRGLLKGDVVCDDVMAEAAARTTLAATTANEGNVVVTVARVLVVGTDEGAAALDSTESTTFGFETLDA